ncbi:ankyrin [Tuber magnatum]|uniref:Ankyrin n=1 Tax=Tuber magnatum TaxID=42249 RepID=A0A317SDI7_9PEZI|nr:ankyrin [Tuber magnatum]
MTDPEQRILFRKVANNLGSATEQNILDELSVKNGGFTTHGSWSLDREMDQRRFDEEHLLGFLKAMKAHIIKKVALAFGAEASQKIPLQLIITTPPWWTETISSSFEALLSTPENPSTKLLCEPEACFAHYLSRTKGVKIANGELLTVCNMEEEVITISHYSVGSVTPVMKLIPKRCDVLLSGSSDIGMRFAELMERRLEGTIKELGVEADEAIAQLDKFLPKFDGKKPYKFRLPWTNAPDSPPHIMSLTMHLAVDDLVSLFEPSFKKIYDYLKLVADTTSKKISILFAGPLTDGHTSGARGAALAADNNVKKHIVNVRGKTNEVKTFRWAGSRLEFLQELEDKLGICRQALISAVKPSREISREYIRLVRAYERLLIERIQRQGYSAPTMAVFKAMDEVHLGMKRSDKSRELRVRFEAGYVAEKKVRVRGPGLKAKDFAVLLGDTEATEFLNRDRLAEAPSSSSRPLADPPEAQNNTNQQSSSSLFPGVSQAPPSGPETPTPPAAKSPASSIPPAQPASPPVPSATRRTPVFSVPPISALRPAPPPAPSSSPLIPGRAPLPLSGGRRGPVFAVPAIPPTPTPTPPTVSSPPPPAPAGPHAARAPIFSVLPLNSGRAPPTRRGPPVHSVAPITPTPSPLAPPVSRVRAPVFAVPVVSCGPPPYEPSETPVRPPVRERAPIPPAAPTGAGVRVPRFAVPAATPLPAGGAPIAPVPPSSTGPPSLGACTPVYPVPTVVPGPLRDGHIPPAVPISSGVRTRSSVVPTISPPPVGGVRPPAFAVPPVAPAATPTPTEPTGSESLNPEDSGEPGPETQPPKEEETDFSQHQPPVPSAEPIPIVNEETMVSSSDVLATPTPAHGEGNLTNSESTPLCAAIIAGNADIVDQLLESGMSPHSLVRGSLPGLHLAASLGHGEIVMIYLGAGADASSTDAAGNSSLHLAAKNGHTVVIEILLQGGAEMEAVNVAGNSSLHEAAVASQAKVVRLLLEKGAGLDRKNYEGRTAFLDTAATGCSEILMLLIDAGADFEASDTAGNSALHLAASVSDEELLLMLLDLGLDPGAKNLQGKIPLHYAVSGKNDPAIKVLLEIYLEEMPATGTFPELPQKKHPLFENWCANEAKAALFYSLKPSPHQSIDTLKTALRWTEYNNNMMIASLIVDNIFQLNPNDPDPTHVLSALLHWAAEEGLELVLKVLLEKEEPKVDKFGSTLLHKASFAGHAAIVGFLLEKFTDPQVRSTALFIASWRGHEPVVNQLLDMGVDLDSKNEDGQTALHWAVIASDMKSALQTLNAPGTRKRPKNRKVNVGTIKLLIDRGAKVNERNGVEQTPLHWAVVRGDLEAIELLLENGADLKAKDDEGADVIEWAANYSETDEVYRLIKGWEQR